MSSDKAPEKVYRKEFTDGTVYFDYAASTKSLDCCGVTTYIREDLIQIGAINEAITQMQVEYHERIDRLNDELRMAKLDRREYITCEQEVEAQRRREMFEKYCIAAIASGESLDGADWGHIGKVVDRLCSQSDKFARGEE